MGVTGSFKELAALREKVASLATPRARSELNAVLAEAALKQIDDEFRESRDPYGQPWKPLVSREGQPLRDTGQLLNSLHPKATESGFEISTNRKGAATHQYGATIVAKTSKGLRFRTRGAPTASNKRGALSNWVTKQQVTIPRRQYMPEVDLGPYWTKALQEAADDFLRARLGA